MTVRAIDPNNGWVFEDGRWVWEGGATTGHIEDGTIDGQITTWDVAKTEWTPDSTITVSAGNVSIGSSGAMTDNLTWGNTTHVNGWLGFGGTSPLPSSDDPYIARGANGRFVFNGRSSSHIDGVLDFRTQDTTRLTIDATGDATFSGKLNVESGRFLRPSGNCGLTISTEAVYPDDGTGNLGSDGIMNIGGLNNRFKDAFFSGTVDAAGFTINGVPIGGGDTGDMIAGEFGWYRNHSGHVGLGYAQGYIAPLNNAGGLTSGACDVGHTTYKFRHGNFTGTVTAADHVATSDERLKDNITTAPVGLIDSIKGREWDWSESGEKGSGVVAQELEKVLPHLVHEDDEGMKSVSYNGLVAYLIEEVKALKAEVEALK